MRLTSFIVVIVFGVFSFSAPSPIAVAADPIIIDEAPAALKKVESRYWATSFSPDGQSVAVTGGWDKPAEPGVLTIFDAPTGAPKLIRRQEQTIRTVAYAPDGKRLAIGDFAGSVRIVNPENGQILNTLPPHEKLVNSVAFSADGKLLFAGSFDGQITMWDVKEETVVHRFLVGDDAIVSLAVGSDNKHLGAVTWHGKLHLWDYPARVEKYTLSATNELPNAPRIVEAIAFAPDSKSFVTGSWDTCLKIRATEGGKVLHELSGHKGSIHCAAYSPTGESLVTSDQSGSIFIWDPVTGDLVDEIIAHTDRCCGLAFSPDGKLLATAGWDRATRIWNTKTWEIVEQKAK